MGYQLPPTFVEVTEKTTKVDVPCAFSADLLDAYANENGIVDYEIILSMPHSDYFVDVEMKNDFLTGNFRMQMFAEDETGHWHKIAHSTWFDEHSFEDVEMQADQLMGTKQGDKTMIQKLRYIENVPPEVLNNASKLSLHLKVNVRNVIDALTKHHVYDPRHEEICFNFDLSLFIDEVDAKHMSDNNDNKLMRVDWQGLEQASGMFDTSGRISAFLEFEKSLHSHIPALKQTFQEAIFLQPLLPNGEPDKSKKHIVPTHFKSKF